MDNRLIPINTYEHYEECPLHEDASGFVCSECGKEVAEGAMYCIVCGLTVDDLDEGLACAVKFSDCICEELEMEFELSEADKVWSRMRDEENEGWE